MNEKWYDDLNEDAFLSEENKKYKIVINRIIDAVKSGLGFDEACETVRIEDPELKSSAVEDALKVLIAELHFTQKLSLEQVAKTLKITVDRINSAKDSMIDEVKEASIKAFHKNNQ